MALVGPSGSGKGREADQVLGGEVVRLEILVPTPGHPLPGAIEPVAFKGLAVDQDAPDDAGVVREALHRAAAGPPDPFTLPCRFAFIRRVQPHDQQNAPQIDDTGSVEIQSFDRRPSSRTQTYQ